MAFHRRTGTLISLSNNNATAQRRYASTEFNNGIVMSSKPLKDNEIFEVKIDKRMNSWSGSVEIGVSACDPESVSLPTSATGLRAGTWILSGCNILKDGHAIKENYGQDLDKLTEGDTLGVMRTSAGILHFLINGQDQGVAAHSIPAQVHAVVDIYGKCMQVTINSLRQLDTNRGSFLANQLANEAIAEATALCSNERLAFHEKCGSLVRLSNENRTAERQRPNGEFNNGVVMTNRPLKLEELFEIRLDTMIDKWSGSIEVGITTHNPSLLEFPATMTNMRSGTIMMSGCGILTNGKGTQREYGQFNLDELSEADRIGLIRKSNGNLHFYINSIDQGVAAENAPDIVWGVVDLYGMAVKVTILDEISREEDLDSEGLAAAPIPRGASAVTVSTPRASSNEHNAAMAIRSSVPATLQSLASRLDPRSDMLGARMRTQREYDSDSDNSEHSVRAVSEGSVSGERLSFHPVCGRHVNVINRNRTARRPNALDEFNYAVVLTNRPLLPGEHFEVQIDKVIDKWAGSVEIGVTTHDPMTLDFPPVMTNIHAGAWMLTGNGVMHDGETIHEDYGYRPDRVKPGDRVGVIYKADGQLYFTVNGVNLGLAASNVPSNVYGVLDLYGQAAEASIIQPIEEAVSTPCSDLRFHTRHGTNCVVVNEGRSAARPNPREEFNDSMVMSNRPLRPNEMFEIVIDKIVDRWSGSLDCGVTTLSPDTLDFPCTMSDMSGPGTWILSGSTIVQEGRMLRNRYSCDLEQLSAGSKVGILITHHRCLHFFLDGVDQGVACTELPNNVYAAVDLYGTCAGVSITSNTGIYDSQRPSVRHTHTTPNNKTTPTPLSKHQINAEQKLASAPNHRFSQCCGKNISLRNEQTTAARVKNFNNAIVFSADPIKTDEIFEIRIDEVMRQWSGSLMIGLTTQTVSESQPIIVTQSTALELHSNAKHTWVVNGPKVLHDGKVIRENYPPLLDRLEIGSRVGIRRCQNGTMHVYVNGEDLGVAAHNIPRNVFLVLDVYGMIESVSIISQTKNSRLQAIDTQATEQPPTDAAMYNTPIHEELYDIDTLDNEYAFHHQRLGKNIQLSHKDTIACRTTGYNQAVVIGSKPLLINNPLEIKIDRLHCKWSSSLMIGVTALPLHSLIELPKSALNINKSTWLIKSTSIFHNSKKVKSGYCTDLDSLPVGTTLSLSLDESRNLHLHINSTDQGIAVANLPDNVYPILDLYGQCYQVSIVRDADERRQTSSSCKEDREKADVDNGIKEKLRPPPNLNCLYQQLCDRFKQCISIPDEFFKTKYNKCFCDSCHKLRAAPLYKVRGNPAREYSVPTGWYRYGLKVKARAKSLRIFDNWNIAYSGINLESVRKVLDCGDLLGLADSTCRRYMNPLCGSHYDEEKKPETFESVPVILSPSIRYAGSNHFTQPIEYRDAKTDKLYKVRLAFEGCVKPGSFNVGPQTLDTSTSEPVDPKLDCSEIEWATKERGSVEIYGLLIRLDSVH